MTTRGSLGGLALLAVGCLGFAQASQAEITLLKATDADTWWAPLSFQVGGSIRPRWRNEMGPQDNDAFTHKGYDGGTRFRFTANYQLNPSTQLIAHWRLGVNMFKLVGWSHHYPPGIDTFYKQKLYVGIDNDSWGRLTIGKQDSVYYTTVGVKTDVWENDWNSKAAAVGVSASYDGSDLPSRTVKYALSVGALDLYAQGFLPDETYHTPAGWYYDRKYGASVGFNYHVSDTLSWSGVYSNIRARTFTDNESREDNQQLAATALAWDDGHWYAAASAEYYGKFVPIRTRHSYGRSYFAGDAYAATGFVAYTQPINRSLLVNLRPYVVGTRLKFVSDGDYYANLYYVGLGAQLKYGFRLAVERTFADTQDDLPDANWVDFYYDF